MFGPCLKVITDLHYAILTYPIVNIHLASKPLPACLTHAACYDKPKAEVDSLEHHRILLQ